MEPKHTTALERKDMPAEKRIFEKIMPLLHLMDGNNIQILGAVIKGWASLSPTHV